MCIPTVSVYKSDSQEEPPRISFSFLQNKCTTSKVPDGTEWRQEKAKVVPDTSEREEVTPAPAAPSLSKAKESEKGDTRDLSASAAPNSTNKKGPDLRSDDCSGKPQEQTAQPENKEAPPAEEQPASASSTKNDIPDITSKKQQRKELQKEKAVAGAHQPEKAKASKATKPPPPKPRSATKPPSSAHQPKETKDLKATTHLPAKVRSAIKSPSSVKPSVWKRVRFEMDETELSEWSDNSSCESYTDPQLPEPSFDDILRNNRLPIVFSASPSWREGSTAHTVHNIDANSRASRLIKSSYRSRKEEGRSHSGGKTTNYGNDKAKNVKEHDRMPFANDPYPSQEWDLDSEIESAVDVGNEALVSPTSSRTTSLNEKPLCEKSPSSRMDSSDAFEDTVSDELDMSDIAERIAKKYPSMLDLESDSKEPLVIWKPNDKVLINGVEPIFVVRKNSEMSSGKSWLLPEEVHSQKLQPRHKTSPLSTPASSTLNVTQQDWSSSAMRAKKEDAQHPPIKIPAPAIQDAARKTPSLRSVHGSIHRFKTAEDIAREQGWTPKKARSRASGYKAPTVQDVPEEPVEQTWDQW